MCSRGQLAVRRRPLTDGHSIIVVTTRMQGTWLTEPGEERDIACGTSRSLHVALAHSEP